MPGPISFHIDSPRAGDLEQAVKVYFAGMQRRFQNQREDIEQIINDGVWDNFTTLSRGGLVPQAGYGSRSMGFPIQWAQARAPITIVARQRLHGLGPEPFLDTRGGRGKMAGKLANALRRGGTVSWVQNSGLRWTLRDKGATALLVVHESGGRRIGRSRAFPQLNSIRIPARPSIFWSQNMSRRIIGVLTERAIATRGVVPKTFSFLS